MTRFPEVPVLIVGAGPAGLTLACDLGRRGIAFRIVDKADRLFIGSRGKGLQPRTLEVFHDLEVIDDILAAGAPFPGFRCYDGDRVLWDRSLGQMLGISEPAVTPDVPYPSAWIIPQWRTDEILQARLSRLGGKVELSTELIAIEQDLDGVTAILSSNGHHERLRVRYLVGTDGGRSFVRKAIGVGFEGETFETERTIIGDVRVDGPLDHEHCHLLTRAGNTSSSGRFSLWGLPGTDYFQLVVNITDEETPPLTLGELQSVLEERSGRTDLRLHDLRWVSLYRVNVRMADRFRVGRVFLAGDAAHVHSSAGGQGLNASVQDAYNLGWKLASVLAGAPEELLDTYEAERFPIAADLLGLTTRWHRQDFASPPSGDHQGSSHTMFQLSLHYRGGPLSWDDRNAAIGVRAGDRAPDAPCHDVDGRATHLFDVFRGTHFTLLAFGGQAQEVLAQYGTGGDHWVRAYQVVHPGRSHEHQAYLVDSDGYINRHFGIQSSSIVLIRPDGYIGLAMGDGTDCLNRLRDYLALTIPGKGHAPHNDH
ncbi:MAG: FAD-dependent monooxygenase [Planctomycetes bacterium]|nr:FAD-dependent monooxygenase [Planctomycetota bacterium]